jgi:hypothetical protein
MKLFSSHFFSLLLLAQALHAQFINFSSQEVAFEKASYILPNENEPELALPIWKDSPKGIYVGVGTDRVFMGTAHSNATYLLALDLEPGIVAYNRMMIEMLKIADDGADLQKMRTNTSYLNEKFAHALQSGAVNNPQFVTETLAHPTWSLLIDNSTSPYDRDLLHWMWRDDAEGAEVIYWKNPQTFTKLQTMAREGRMQAEIIDLKNISMLQELQQSIAQAHLKISVVDFSNTQMPTYLGPNGITLVREQLAAIMQPKTILLFSWVNPDPSLTVEYASFLHEKYNELVFTDLDAFNERAHYLALTTNSQGR